MSINDLRKLGQALKEATTCPHCDGSQLIAATSHKGHGTGVHGSVNYRATGHEEITPFAHCTCPGGPVWQIIATNELGQGFKLVEAQKRYPNLPEGQIPFWNPDLEQFCSIPAKTWREAVKASWEYGDAPKN